MAKTEKNLVVKSNKLITASYKLAANEQKLMLKLASMVNMGEEEFHVYSFNVKEFMGLLQLKGKSCYEDLQELTKGLIKKVLVIRESEKTVQMSWLSQAVYLIGKGTVELCFAPELKPYLFGLKKRFTKFYLDIALRLKSGYSIRIYELLKQYEKVGKRTLGLDDLKQILGIGEDEYKLYANFKRKILLVSQKELSQKADIGFTFNELKIVRKVTAIEFKISSNTTKQLAIKKTVKQTQVSEKTIFSFLPEEHRDKKTIQEAVKAAYQKHGIEYVERNIKYANANCKKNYRAYLIKALQEDWGKSLQEDESVKKAKKQHIEKPKKMEFKLGPNDTQCPNCKQELSELDDKCENCGAQILWPHKAAEGLKKIREKYLNE